MGPVRSARLQHFQITVCKPVTALPVGLVERQNQELSEGIDIDISRSVQKVRNIAPPESVILSKMNRVPVEMFLRIQPEIGKLFSRQLPLLPPCVMDGILKPVHRSEERRVGKAR